MALTIRNIKKWWLMLIGKSILHVNQDEGKVYSFKKIEGYYNNLTEKVTKDKKNYSSVSPMTTVDDKGRELIYPVVVFQYGLGAYDLYLMNKDKELMEKKFLSQLEWAFKNQLSSGGWDNFGPIYPNYPFSSMAQGEGASLLIRGYIHTGETRYLLAAKKAIDFMLIDIEHGGTAKIKNNKLYFYEFTCFPPVYNGWIFSIFGLLDYWIISNDEKYKKILDFAINSIAEEVKNMDVGYWSKYREDNIISSPFYHKLHINQLIVLYKYSKIEVFNDHAKKFQKYQNSFFKRNKAFYTKAFQKLFDR